MSGANKSQVMSEVTSAIQELLSEGYFIGEPIYVSDMYTELKKIQSVLDVVDIKITNISGGEYSFIVFDVNSNLSPDGTSVVCPKNALFELKFPETDIKGKVR